MGSIRVSTAIWPVVVVTFDGVVSDPEFDTYLRQFSDIYARRSQFAAVFDASTSGVPSVPQRQRQAAWMMERDQDIRRYALGLAFVFSSPVFRFVLSSIFLIQPLPCEYIVCPSLEKGLDWANKQLRTAQFEPVPRSRTGTS